MPGGIAQMCVQGTGCGTPWFVQQLARYCCYGAYARILRGFRLPAVVEAGRKGLPDWKTRPYSFCLCNVLHSPSVKRTSTASTGNRPNGSPTDDSSITRGNHDEIS